MFSITIAIFWALIASVVVQATPLALVPRTPYDPKITSPKSGTVWQAGSQVTVTWDVTGIPSSALGTSGQLVLGYLEDGSLNEHLMIDSPLAEGFKYSDSKATFTVPSVQSRVDYIVVLFGDSGNKSPTFTIKGTSPTTTGSSGAKPASTASGPSTETTVTAPIPITGTTITGGTGTSTTTATTQTTPTTQTTATTPTTLTTQTTPTAPSSPPASSTASATAAASSQTGAAWRMRAPMIGCLGAAAFSLSLIL